MVDRGIQLFGERLSKKVHATTPKGIVDGFDFTVLSKTFEATAREAVDVCLRVLRKAKRKK